MKINVKSLQGDEYIVEVQNDQLVSDLKAFISEKANGLAIGRQKLVYKGRTMQDLSPVGDYNLEDGCKVHLILQKEVLAGAPNPSGATSYQASTSCSIATTPQSTTAINSATKPCPMDTTSTITDRNCQQINASNSTTTITAASNAPQNDCNRVQSRFEVILRERLAQHFSPDAVGKIMANLQHEINADINSSSLDDLERLAKQKLNISNE